MLALLGKKYFSERPGEAAGGSGAGGSGMSKSEVARVASSAGTGKVGERRRANMEVVDLCDSP